MPLTQPAGSRIANSSEPNPPHRPEHPSHMMAETREPTERRPWGCFYIVDGGPGFQIKRIVVHPGGQLSLQSHHHRAEHWTIVEGDATVTVGAEAREMRRGESIDIAVGERHRLQNFGTTDVVVAEIQFGDYLGEDDIVRYEDFYARG